jgi:predicted nuclease with TOPRIM domain
MENTPVQNVIDRVEKLIKENKLTNEEKRKLNIVISYLWDELDNERKTMSEIFDKSKKEHIDVTGKMWVNKHFIDYKKFL